MQDFSFPTPGGTLSGGIYLLRKRILLEVDLFHSLTH